MALGKNVRRLRKAKGIDLPALAHLSGVAVGSISALELRDSVRSQFASSLAKALNIDLEFLVNFEGEVVVKRLLRDSSEWWLTSDNPDQRRYPRVRCNGGTEILGEVVYRQTETI